MFLYLSSVIQDLPAIIAQGGYLLVFLIIILEGFPIIGSFLPGHLIIIAAGFLVKLGIFDLGTAFIVAVIAAIIADTITYSFGKKYGYSFLLKFAQYLSIRKERLEKLQAFIDAHTGKALVLGKFSPFSRPFIAFLVGAHNVKLKTFWIYNTFGILLWISASLLIGYVFGASYAIASQFVGKFIILSLVITVLIILCYRFINIRFHIFKKYELIILGVNLISLWVFFKTVQDALSANSFFTDFDVRVSLFMAENVTPFVGNAAHFISTIGSTTVLSTTGICLGIIFLFAKKWRRAGILIFSVGSTVVTVYLLKEIFLRARPLNALYEAHASSFPSGHAAMAGAFFIVIAYIFARHVKFWIYREILIGLCILSIILIGLSRVVSNVHWASDVIGGAALGVFLGTSSILFVKYLAALFLRKNL